MSPTDSENASLARIIVPMRKAKASAPGLKTRTSGKTTISSPMTPVFAAGKGRADAKRLKSGRTNSR